MNNNKYDDGYNHGYQEGLNKNPSQYRGHSFLGRPITNSEASIIGIVFAIIVYLAGMWFFCEIIESSGYSGFWKLLAPFWPIIAIVVIIYETLQTVFILLTMPIKWLFS